MPKFSIIVPCYNQALFLDECLRSVYNQTLENWECIIINDGSTDNTKDVAATWTQKDQRFRYFEQENQGVTSARNFGLDVMKGSWVQFLDGDDFLLSSKLASSSKYTDEYNFIYTNFSMLTDGKSEPPFCDFNSYALTVENIISQWDLKFNLPIHCPAFKKDLVDNLRFNENFDLHEDWLFWVELFNKNKIKSRYIAEPLSVYRNHKNSNTKNIDKLTGNLHKVYLYAFNHVLSATQQNLLFESITGKYTYFFRLATLQERAIEKLKRSRLLRARNFIYRYFKI